MEHRRRQSGGSSEVESAEAVAAVSDETAMNEESNKESCSDEEASSFTLKCMTWNIDGLNSEKLKARTEAVCKIIEEKEADIVFLQEVIPETADYIVERMSNYHCYFADKQIDEADLENFLKYIQKKIYKKEDQKTGEEANEDEDHKKDEEVEKKENLKKDADKDEDHKGADKSEEHKKNEETDKDEDHKGADKREEHKKNEETNKDEDHKKEEADKSEEHKQNEETDKDEDHKKEKAYKREKHKQNEEIDKDEIHKKEEGDKNEEYKQNEQTDKDENPNKDVEIDKKKDHKENESHENNEDDEEEEDEDEEDERNSYFVGTLLKKSSISVISEKVIHFPFSLMSRNLLKVNVTYKNLPICLLNSHLESLLDGSKRRKLQLRIIFKHMLDAPENETVIFGGDTNLRENEISEIGGLPAGIEDAWITCGSQKRSAYTFDLSINDNLKVNWKSKPRCRYDRIYVRRSSPSKLKPTFFGLVGLERPSLNGCFPSDHWGILCHFEKDNFKFKLGDAFSDNNSKEQVLQPYWMRKPKP